MDFQRTSSVGVRRRSGFCIGGSLILRRVIGRCGFASELAWLAIKPRGIKHNPNKYRESLEIADVHCVLFDIKIYFKIMYIYILCKMIYSSILWIMYVFAHVKL